MTAPLGEARCRAILEVAPDASLEEIRRAHGFLRALYAPGSSVLPAMDEFDPARQARVLAEIEAAFLELSAQLETAQAAPPPRPRPQDPDRVLDGAGMRKVREDAGFSLDHLAAETSVRASHLQALEEERFADLPSAAVIVRGYLTAYFAALNVAGDASVADYVKRFLKWQGKP